MINKSATLVGTIAFKHNANRTAIYVGINSNTGTTIVWQRVNGGRSTRLTGRNMEGFKAELIAALANGLVSWADDHNAIAYAAFINERK